MPVPLEQFVKHLEGSGILAGGTLQEFVPPKAFPKDAEELVRELVRQKKLTKFQAEHVWQGKGKSLVLGNYLLLEKIGAGGMGQVFKAQHRRMDRLVAVKLLSATMTKNKDAIARFEREVKAAAKLRHPNIIAADDADQANGIHFLVMELVDGSDLSALVKKNGPFPVDKAVNYILQAAKGLEFAHAEGVVHRDIKPANLLLDKKGTVKILDMGLARIHGDAAGQAELTATGAVMGTVDYMAPEQALNTKTADARADIYALGCSLYYLLTGKATYDGDTLMAKLLAHRELPIPDLRAVVPQVSDQLETIFKTMVAKKTEDRYQTMTAVIADLEGCGGGQTVNPPSFSVSDTGLTNFLKEVEIAQQSVVPKKAPVRTPKRSGLNLNWQSIAKHKRKLLIGGGVLGVLVLLVTVVISVRTKDDAPVEDSGKKSNPAKLATVSKEGWQDWPADAPPPAIAPFNAEQARKHQEDWAAYLKVPVEYTNSIGMKFRLIPPAEFMMGSTAAEIEEALKDAGDGQNLSEYWRTSIKREAPRHKVILSRPMYLGVHEVTQAEYEKVMGDNPSHFAPMGAGKESVAGIDTTIHPVEMASWNDAAEFCATLSVQEDLQPFYLRAGETTTPMSNGTGYRLPSEAEWESACRAGTTTNYWIGAQTQDLERAGWFSGNAGGRTHAAGGLKASPFGLFDMHGNVWEWVQDWWEPTYYQQLAETPAINPCGPVSAGTQRIFRGGNYEDSGSGCRASSRFIFEPFSRFKFIGFRVSLTVEAVKQLGKVEAETRNNPEFQQWLKAVARMSAERQVEAVAKKLVVLNPGFDGKVTPSIDKGIVTHLDITSNIVTDISPVRGLTGLRTFSCGSEPSKGMSTFSDLSSLKGMPLTNLHVTFSAITDLSPLKGMPLTAADFRGTKIADLSPLKGMPLSGLDCGETNVSDLSPLKGIRLTFVGCRNCPNITDLSPLSGMPLKSLTCDFKPDRDTDILRSIKTLETINGKPAAEFWKEVAAKQAAKQK